MCAPSSSSGRHGHIYRLWLSDFFCSSNLAPACLLSSFLVMGCYGPYSRPRQPIDSPDLGKEIGGILEPQLQHHGSAYEQDLTGHEAQDLIFLK